MDYRKLLCLMFSLFFIGQQDLLGRQDDYDEYDLFCSEADGYRIAVENAEKTGNWKPLLERTGKEYEERLLDAVKFEKMDCSATMKAAIGQAKTTLAELKKLAREKKSPEALYIEMTHFVGIHLLAKEEFGWFEKIEDAVQKSLKKRAELASKSLGLQVNVTLPVTNKKKKRSPDKKHTKKSKKNRAKRLKRDRKKKMKVDSGGIADIEDLPVALRVADEVVTVQAVTATTFLGRFAEKMRAQVGVLGNCASFFRQDKNKDRAKDL